MEHVQQTNIDLNESTHPSEDWEDDEIYENRLEKEEFVELQSKELSNPDDQLSPDSQGEDDYYSQDSKSDIAKRLKQLLLGLGYAIDLVEPTNPTPVPNPRSRRSKRQKRPFSKSTEEVGYFSLTRHSAMKMSTNNQSPEATEAKKAKLEANLIRVGTSLLNCKLAPTPMYANDELQAEDGSGDT